MKSSETGRHAANAKVRQRQRGLSPRQKTSKRPAGHSFLSEYDAVASGSMDWVSRCGEKTTQCFLVPGPCLPLQLFFSAFVMLNATGMGGSVAEVRVTDGGSVVAEPQHRREEGRGGEAGGKTAGNRKAPQRRPRGVKMVRGKNGKRMKRDNKAELFSTTSKSWSWSSCCDVESGC